MPCSSAHPACCRRHPCRLGRGLRYAAARGRPRVVGRERAAAREVLARTHPDLILLDVMMPGEDGFTVCATLHAHPTWRDIPVIFLTAIDAAEQKVRAFAAGAVDYATKPVHVPELVARVRAQLALRDARRALEQNHELEAEVAVRLDAEEQLAASLDRAVLVLDRTGAVVFGTRLAHDLIAKHLPARPARLPHRRRPVSRRQRRGHAHRASLRRSRPRRHRDARARGRTRPAQARRLIALGLTVRQAEVAYWVAQGKSNSETALILGTSPRTVDKHMERIFQRLGVENRASLMMVASSSPAPQAHLSFPVGAGPPVHVAHPLRRTA